MLGTRSRIRGVYQRREAVSGEDMVLVIAVNRLGYCVDSRLVVMEQADDAISALSMALDSIDPVVSAVRSKLRRGPGRKSRKP